MSGCRVALVADDVRLASAVQAHLKKAPGQPALLCRYDTIRPHLGHDRDGLLLLAVACTPDTEPLRRLVQEVVLQRLPAQILLLDARAAASDDLAALDAYVAGRLRCPDDARTLSDWVARRQGQGAAFTRTEEEPLEDVIGRRLLSQTPSLVPLVERLALAAQHDVTVLLTGETGTGKTYLARLLHECSPRKAHRFLVVPCGALAANLVESEFFGHVRGAFTGADRPKVGKFAAAGQGTLLLDEIDALGLEQQTNLLRVIETGEYEPVGGNDTQLCTARIIVASNWNLDDAVEQGKFRRDLYYRLNVMSFHLPPLRERVQDIAPLVRGMTARFTAKFRKELFDVSPEAMAALEAYPWPGNLRQMENVVQQAVLLSSGPELLPRHLPPTVREYAPVRAAAVAGEGDSLVRSREAMERAVIQRALVSCGYSRSRTAAALGISRVTLYKKMKKYDLMNLPLHPVQAE